MQKIFFLVYLNLKYITINQRVIIMKIVYKEKK